MSHCTGRNVRVSSVCIQMESRKMDYTDLVIEEVCRVAQQGTDLILTPEVWTKEIAVSENGTYCSPALDRLKEIARRYHTYIVVLIKRLASDSEKQAIHESKEASLYQEVDQFMYNSAILLDREGKAVFAYDKVFPVLSEIYSAQLYSTTFSKMLTSPLKSSAVIPGNHLGVYPCDFGMLGMAICFDMNYPELFRQMALAGAEVVVWSASYSGGRNARMMAGIFNYYVVTCSSKYLLGDCRFCDITGDELLVTTPEEGERVYSATLDLDLDRTVFHRDYNENQIQKILLDYDGKVSADFSFRKEGWIILQSQSSQVLVSDLIEQYGLMPIRQYKFGPGAEELRKLRGTNIYWR